jgi:hypothetical protein
MPFAGWRLSDPRLTYFVRAIWLADRNVDSFYPVIRLPIDRTRSNGEMPGVATVDRAVPRPKAEPATAGRRLSGAPAEASERSERSAVSDNYAAFFFGWIRPRSIKSSAICTALSAAPLRRLSETIHIDRPFSMVESSRMREMKVESSPAESSGVM